MEGKGWEGPEGAGRLAGGSEGEERRGTGRGVLGGEEERGGWEPRPRFQRMCRLRASEEANCSGQDGQGKSLPGGGGAAEEEGEGGKEELT